jgi:hypothetical protein
LEENQEFLVLHNEFDTHLLGNHELYLVSRMEIKTLKISGHELQNGDIILFKELKAVVIKNAGLTLFHNHKKILLAWTDGTTTTNLRSEIGAVEVLR